jgi:hypothetical protein
VFFALVAIALCDLPFKNVQGPPEEFDMHKLPSPSATASSSDSAMFPVYLRKEESDSVTSWVGDIPVDSESLFTVTFVSKHAKTLNLDVFSVTDIKNNKVTSNELPVPTDVHTSWFGFNVESSAPSKTFEFKKPVRGSWTVRVFNTAASFEKSSEPTLFLIAYNESPDRVSSHLGSYKNYAGDKFTVVASLKRTEANGDRIIAPHELDSPLLADLDITTPKGETHIVTMHDDGNHGDNAPNDGIYGASFSADDAGSYTAQVVMSGNIQVTGGSVAFRRTSQHLVAVVDKKVELAKEGANLAVNLNDEMSEIKIPATIVGDVSKVVGSKFKAYAEVWATADDKTYTPVAFITGMTIAEKVDETHVALPLKMSMKWFSRKNAQLPVVLRNVYIQDVSTSVPLSTADEIKTTVTVNRAGSMFTNDALLRFHWITNTLYKFVSDDDETMYYGKRPAQLLRSANANGNHKVLLVHGYCSEATPFTAEDFTDALVFLDKKSNRNHDDFANLIGEFGKDLDSFSVIGHSQAGPASLHLLTFYWSKQDTAQLPAGHRLIQTVGSPWRGSGLAGSMASIGGAFGVGCGKNHDLTHEGSAQWLTTIPSKTRSFVYYHTSQFPKGGYCSWGANWVLESPNDGTTELEYANLDGGNNVSHTLGWCHVTEMNHPPQCHDHTRNKEMNTFAKL